MGTGAPLAWVACEEGREERIKGERLGQYSRGIQALIPACIPLLNMMEPL